MTLMQHASGALLWTEANQRFLGAEFARIKACLRGEPAGGCVLLARDIRAEMEEQPAIDWLTERFDLSRFERDLLLLCAGVEMDSEMAMLCAEANGTANQPSATFALALGTLAEAHWSALTPLRPLRRFQLVSLDAHRGLTAAQLRIDERVLHFLAGTNALDVRLEGLLREGASPTWIGEEHQAIASDVANAMAAYAGDALVLHLCGDDAQGQEDVATFAAHAVHKELFLADAEHLPSIGTELDQFETLWRREAILLNGMLMIQGSRSGWHAAARLLAERVPGTLIAGSREPVALSRRFLRFAVDKPKPVEQKRLWQHALNGAAAGERADEALSKLAGQFRLSAKAIHETGAMARGVGGPITADDLWPLCRAMSRPRLEDLAQRIVPQAGWEDLVLPDMQMQILRQLASQVRHRMKVYESWGFAAQGPRGLGVSALFSGESGVGKTLAAEVLARHLELDLYRVDVSAVVSKYIGETSKNMRQVFDAAEQGGVLLLFDEADALFGKRSEVKDSHDRYANIDVSYLLQRMETYQGVSVLTTNMRTSVDRAFQRRLRFMVTFPFPDVAQREAIWARVFPRQTATQDLHWKKLAQLNVAGGSIRNIALNAAFLAAEAGTAVTMSHVLNAARLEAQKMDRALSEAEIRGWV